MKGVYSEVQKRNLLGTIDSEEWNRNAALINMIEDYDGATGEMLKDVQRLEKARKTVTTTLHCDAGEVNCDKYKAKN